MNTTDFSAKIAAGQGFIAALDQSGGSSPKTLRAYGVGDDEWDGEEEMFARIHEMRARIIASPALSGDKVLGTILFETTMDGLVAGKPTPQVLLDKGIAPIIKIDKGLAAEENGVQLMNPMPELDALLARAKGLGVYGTKERSVINSANAQGIAAIVAQQFEVASTVLAAGLMPILEPEFTITAPDRAEGEDMLKAELLKHLDAMPEGSQVMIKLSLPVKAGLYREVVDHPNCLKVVALSGGFSREQACEQLALNTGMIASFSRATLEGLTAQMSQEEFDATLGASVDAICNASRT